MNNLLPEQSRWPNSTVLMFGKISSFKDPIKKVKLLPSAEFIVVWLIIQINVFILGYQFAIFVFSLRCRESVRSDNGHPHRMTCREPASAATMLAEPMADHIFTKKAVSLIIGPIRLHTTRRFRLQSNWRCPWLSCPP